MKNFCTLKQKDCLTIVAFIVISFIWILIDQIFLTTSSSKFAVFSILIIGMFFCQYLIHKPQDIWSYANSLSLFLIIFVVSISIVIHVFIKHDFSEMLLHSLALWTITGIVPYISALLHKFSLKK